MTKTRKGALYCILAGVAWGFAGACGQYLFQRCQWDVDFLIPARILLAGAVMVLIARYAEGKGNWLRVFSSAQNVRDLLIFGILGIGLCQYSYYVTISASNATTATVLCYLGPVLILLWVALRERRMPDRRETLAVLCAVVGVFFLATHGDPTSLSLSQKALFWGLVSAVATAIYSVQPKRLTAECGALSATGWGMVMGGIVLSVLRQPWAHVTGLFDAPAWFAFAAVVGIGSVLSFGLFFVGLGIVGPTRASVLCATEPLTSVLFSLLWLHVTFTAMDALGFALILSTIFLLAKE